MDISPCDGPCQIQEVDISRMGGSESHQDNFSLQHSFKRSSEAFSAAPEEPAEPSTAVISAQATCGTEFFELSPR